MKYAHVLGGLLGSLLAIAFRFANGLRHELSENADAGYDSILANKFANDTFSSYRTIASKVNSISEGVMKQRIDKLNLSVPECDAWNSCKSKCVADVSNGGLHFHMSVLHNDNYISREPLCNGAVWEASTVDQLVSFFKETKNGNFLDVGANLGSFSLPLGAFMKRRGAGTVIAVEANPDVVSILEESISANQFSEIVKPHSVALVRDVVQTPHVCNSIDDTLESSNPGGNQVDLGNRNFGDCGHKIPTKTLDMLYKEEPTAMSQLVAAKLDCEGCEGQALLGARQLLSEHPPCYLLFEVTEYYLCEAGTSLGDIYKLLEATGYDTAGQPQPHGDGSCESFHKWVGSHAQDSHVQSFALFPQRDIQACTSRFH